jgi:dTDP-4-amino-4,6-dideoxygalactose transaminase
MATPGQHANETGAIPLLDPRRALQDGRLEAYVAAARETLAGGQYILGAAVARLEQVLGEMLGARHAIGVSSGTDALLLALMGVGVGPGDQVVCPSFTFFATAGAVARVGATPAFADVCPACFTLGPSGVQAAATQLTRALLPVHLFGRAAPMHALAECARARRLALIEDAAQALGTRAWAGAVGTLGDVGCFSFFPSKNLGGFGDGGLVTTGDAALAARMRALRVHGAGSQRYLHEAVGGNFRLDALQAALLFVRVPALEGALARRRAHHAQYRAAFVASGLGAEASCGCAEADPAATAQAPVDVPDAPIVLPQLRSGETANQFVVRLGAPGLRDHVADALRSAGIGHAIYYPVPLHLQPCFAHLGYGRGALPVTERLAGEVLALPIDAETTSAEVARVADVVTATVRARGAPTRPMPRPPTPTPRSPARAGPDAPPAAGPAPG